jgi:hypothetical protein
VTGIYHLKKEKSVPLTLNIITLTNDSQRNH